MMALSQTVGYAVQALACMDSDECANTTYVKDIAVCSDVPPAYLAKIFAKLVQAGILQSKRGYKGGTSLARPPETITLLEITNVLDGSDWNTRCLLGLEGCSDDRNCPTHAFWKVTREAITHKLAETSLADLFAFEARKRALAKRKPKNSPITTPLSTSSQTPSVIPS